MPLKNVIAHAGIMAYRDEEADKIDQAVALLREAMTGINAGTCKLTVKAEYFDLKFDAATRQSPPPEPETQRT